MPQTEEELAQYRGLNVSATEDDSSDDLQHSTIPTEVPESVDWISKGRKYGRLDRGYPGYHTLALSKLFRRDGPTPPPNILHPSGHVWTPQPQICDMEDGGTLLL